MAFLSPTSETAREHFLAFSHSAPAAAVMVDGAGRVVEANPWGCFILGEVWELPVLVAEQQSEGHFFLENKGRFHFRQAFFEVDNQRLPFYWLQRADENVAGEADMRLAARNARMEAFTEELKAEILERNRVEDALRYSEIRYKSLVESLPHGIAIVSQYDVIFMNPTMMKMFGVEDVREISGPEKMFLTVAEEDRERVRNLTGKLRSGEQTNLTYTTRLQRKDGSTFHGAVYVNPILWEGKTAFQTLVMDISERMKAREALQESEDRFRSLTETIPLAVVMHRGDCFLYANPAMVNLSGYSREELQKTNFLELIEPGQRHIVKAQVQARLRREKVPMRYDSTLLRKDGELVDVEIAANLISFDGHPTIIAAMRDITGRKASQLRAQENERFLLNVFDSIADGVCVLDKDLQVIRLNRTLEKWYPHSRPLTGRACHEIFHDSTRPCPDCPSIQAIKKNEPCQKRVETLIHPNQKCWLEVSAFPLRNVQGEVQGVVETVRDVTGAMQTEKRCENQLKDQQLLNYLSEHLVSGNEGAFSSFLEKLTELLPASQASLFFLERRQGNWALSNVWQSPGSEDLGDWKESPPRWLQDLFSLLEKRGFWNGSLKDVEKVGLPELQKWLEHRSLCRALSLVSEKSDWRALLLVQEEESPLEESRVQMAMESLGSLLACYWEREKRRGLRMESVSFMEEQYKSLTARLESMEVRREEENRLLPYLWDGLLQLAEPGTELKDDWHPGERERFAASLPLLRKADAEKEMVWNLSHLFQKKLLCRFCGERFELEGLAEGHFSCGEEDDPKILVMDHLSFLAARLFPNQKVQIIYESRQNGRGPDFALKWTGKRALQQWPEIQKWWGGSSQEPPPQKAPDPRMGLHLYIVRWFLRPCGLRLLTQPRNGSSFQMVLVPR